IKQAPFRSGSGLIGLALPITNNDDMFRDICTAATFAKFVHDEVLSKCGAAAADLFPRPVASGQPQALYYNGEEPKTIPPFTYPDPTPVEEYTDGVTSNPTS